MGFPPFDLTSQSVLLQACFYRRREYVILPFGMGSAHSIRLNIVLVVILSVASCDDREQAEFACIAASEKTRSALINARPAETGFFSAKQTLEETKTSAAQMQDTTKMQESHLKTARSEGRASVAILENQLADTKARALEAENRLETARRELEIAKLAVDQKRRDVDEAETAEVKACGR